MNEQLPTERDFLEHHACLDAQAAWSNFGGLTLDEAYAKFCDGPEIYLEDFMFMGEGAFGYYFPVLDRFVREASLSCTSGSHDEFWIISHAIAQHVLNGGSKLPDGVVTQVAELCTFVIEHLMQVDFDKLDCSWSKIATLRAWKNLQSLVAA